MSDKLKVIITISLIISGIIIQSIEVYSNMPTNELSYLYGPLYCIGFPFIYWCSLYNTIKNKIK